MKPSMVIELQRKITELKTEKNAVLLVHNYQVSEIQEIADEMLKLVKPKAPLTFKKIGPSCVQWNFCPEGHLTCGKMKEIVEKYKKI